MTTHESQLMEALCQYIQTHCERALPLQELAQQAGLSPAHFQRRFKAVIGVSPKEYTDQCRLEKLKQVLRMEDKVTGALYEAGFTSPSRVYEKIDSNLGMTPKQYQNKGKGMAISWSCSKTVLGLMMIAATDRGLCFVQFGDDKALLFEQLQKEYSQAFIQEMDQTHQGQLTLWMQYLSTYLEGLNNRLNIPLDIRGTAFQIKVWKYLRTIPKGKTQSYTEVAQAIGQPKAFRAVASACAKNNVALVIPCHRVLRGNGDLAGYRWGMERKKALLTMEQNVER